MPRRHVSLPALAVVLSLFALAHPAVSAQSSSANPFEWRGVVLQGGTLEIKGVNGDVRAEPGSGAEAEVVARKTSRRSNPEDVRIEVVQHGEGITICAVYPDAGSRPNECRPGTEGRMNVRDNDVKVSFTVRVPPGVRFAGRTVNGDVTSGELTGPVSLRTVNGTAEFATTAQGDASTVNGDIKGRLGSTIWNGRLEFSTVNGSILLELPADLSADLRATTVNGEIATDFPLTMSGRISRRQISGTIGAGGRSLELETVNGDITLRRR